MKKANVRQSKFHDLRNTALTNWFGKNIKEFEVMKLAGHSEFSTTHKHYLAFDKTVRNRARLANKEILAHIWRTPSSEEENSLTKNS